ncbi:hypothetical protein [Mycolicibacterium mageritense]|uniref:Uncharacterized protein n=1 Tax=Mycolicibacterium mageritense TaxID=53462 RepID=A0AAI8XN94_MYCME|nr:hypothetical protein [Mycolicibacterium mageritense]BDY31449.1 hypothetical protein hbim_05401 [Mycolicibacterium mageritense]
MINAHTPEQVAEAYAHIIPGEHKVRWLKDRLADGRIPSKRLTRNARVMTDKHIEQWLEGDDQRSTTCRSLPERADCDEPDREDELQPTNFVIQGLSPRSRARIVRPR